MVDKKSPTAVEQVIEPGREEEVEYSVIQDKPKKKWTSYLWDTLDKSPEERRFLFKLDAAVLTFASLGKSNPIWCKTWLMLEIQGISLNTSIKQT